MVCFPTTSNKEEDRMSRTRRVLTLALLALGALGAARGDLAAQEQQNRSGTVLVPIAGLADAGGQFSGTWLIQRFEAQGNAVLAIGTVSGALSDASGVTRNLVTQVTMPLDINASVARRSSDFTIAQASCEALHLEFGASAINVLGSTIGLDSVAADIVAAVQPGAVPAQSAATTAQPIADPFAPTVQQPATTAVQPGVTTTVQPSTGTSQLGSLLCSADLRSQRGARLARLLNQILAALA
jgi:hypothetical protein